VTATPIWMRFTALDDVSACEFGPQQHGLAHCVGIVALPKDPSAAPLSLGSAARSSLDDALDAAEAELLQRIAEDQLKGWDAKRVESLRSHFERDLYRRGVEKAGPAAELVVAALKNTLADERGRWLLGPHPVALNEHRLRNRLRSFRIDRYIEDAGGKWVVDYKTSEHTGGGVDAFLDAERARYQAQLDAYAKATGGARPAIYFPLLKGWREWP